MYLRLALLLLPFMWEWQVVVADCEKACYDYEGTYREPCAENRTSNGDNTGGGQGRAVTLVKCDEDEVFSGSDKFYKLPSGVTDIVITGITLFGLDHFIIGRLICSYEYECFTLKLTSDAKPAILIRLKKSTFKIKFFGLEIEISSLTFRAVCDRQCAKMKMPANNGLMKRIVDGTVADVNEFPFIVRLSIYYSPFNDPNNYVGCNSNGWVSYDDTKRKCTNNDTLLSYICGGSILNKDWILSAQHCFYETITHEEHGLANLVGVVVHAGDHNIYELEDEEESRWVSLANIKRAPDFNVGGHLNNDLALLKVNFEISLDPKFRYPICLPPSYMDKLPFLDGCAVEAAGWGTTDTAITSDVLVKGDFTVVNNAACKIKYAGAPIAKVITDKMICTDHEETVKCSGDSGGPVFCKSWSKHFYQVGVISFGELKTDDPFVWDNTFPEVNARVTKFDDWIKGIVGAENLP